MNTLNLMTAAGDSRVELIDPRLDAVPVPQGPRHHPIPHRLVINTITETLSSRDYTVNQMVHALSGDNGQRYFGMAQVSGGAANDEFSTVIGFRAAHDQRYSVGLVGGSGIFVCSNLCFHGEVKLNRKHTGNVERDLPALVADAIGRLDVANRAQAQNFKVMKQAKLKESWADALVTKLVREEIIAPSQVGRVISEFDEPSHDEFTEDGFSVWRMFNAVTEAYKPTTTRGNNLGTLVNKSPALYAYCNEVSKSIVAA